MLKPDYILKMIDKDLTMESLQKRMTPNRPPVPKSMENSGLSGSIW